MAQALLLAGNQINIFFAHSGYQEPKPKLEHLNLPGSNDWWDTFGTAANVPSLSLWRAWTVLGIHAPLCQLSTPCQLQQPTLPTANVSHVGRSMNIMPKCNTGPDAIKIKNSCWCKHYAFTSPSLTSLLHSQQQAAISLVISTASSNAHLPVFNPLCSPSYHPMANPALSTISSCPDFFPSPLICLASRPFSIFLC